MANPFDQFDDEPDPAAGIPLVTVGQRDPSKVRAETRADEDQQMQREAAERAERAAIRADATAQRQAAAAERAAEGATKPTELQSKSAGFYGRLLQSERDFGAVSEEGRAPRSLGRQALRKIAPGIENTTLNTPDRQKADQAVENFIAASLRLESGAAIADSEFDRQYRIFFPAPGDSNEVLAQKAAARQQAINGFRIAAGPLAEEIDAGMPEAPGPEVSAADGATPAADVPPGGPRSSYDEKMTSQLNTLLSQGVSKAMIDTILKQQNFSPLDPSQYTEAMKWMKANPGKPFFGAEAKVTEAPPSYQTSLLGQGMSGVNEGIASTIGGPVDLVTGAVNLIPRGLNAIANTNIPTIENPVLGSDWIKDRMGGWGIYDETSDPTTQFVRRVGESVGAGAIPSGIAGSLPRAGAALLTGAGGGAGAATAEAVFPGNPLAEFAGEAIGGGLTGAGLYKGAQRAAQRDIEAAIPTVDGLKQQASELYRQAEARGVTADPMLTQRLSDNFRAALQSEGRISPTGRISEVYPKAKEAMQLVEDYSGSTMNPTQMQTVRQVAADGMTSPDSSERRLGSILTDVFDEWSAPLAPELPQARDVASRYLNAEKLEQARELAGARASQFTGSGFENALRTEYRGLDRQAIKGQGRYSDSIHDAIQDVARGTPGSNLARAIGRFAPTGPVSAGLGTGVPAAVGAAVGGPAGALALGGTAATVGTLGRVAATHMGIRNADVAELIARNGGAIPTAQIMTPELERLIAASAAAQSAKYLGEQ